MDDLLIKYLCDPTLTFEEAVRMSLAEERLRTPDDSQGPATAGRSATGSPGATGPRIPAGPLRSRHVAAAASVA